MATYVNDLRLKEITTGDESGTWGTSTNTNLELIGEALGYATEAVFDSDGNKTTTVADGATDPARAMYYKVTGSATLSATRTLTIAPDTVSRVMWVENATTGSQSITVSQGSGASVTIANGKTKILYLDGAGSGAAVVDALGAIEDLIKTGTNASLTQLNITAQGDLRLEDSSGGEYVALQAPSTVGSNVTFTLPAADGSASQVLKTDGSGNLGFMTVAGTGTGASFTQVDITAQGDLRLQDSTGGEYIGFDAPATVSSSVTYTLPEDGSSGQVLKTNGSGTLSWVAINTPGAAAEFTQVDITAQGDLRLQDTSGGQYVALQAPGTVASSFTLTLPTTDGSASEYLQTDGSGNLSWDSGTGQYSAWSVITTATSLVAKGQYVSNSGSGLTHTLPAGTAGDTITLSNAGSGTVTVGRTSSQKIDSAAEDGTLYSGSSVQLVYVDDTIGWHSL